MKRDRTIIGRIAKAAELPQDLDPHQFFVQWIGAGECLIEQHRGILCFRTSEIRFSTEQGTLSVCGDALILDGLTDTRAKVSGTIQSISLEAKS